jgi:choline dehydrogenase-like flavoprotein
LSGLGLAGGVAALPLTRAGLDVVALSAGPRVSREDLSVDELSLMNVKRII